MVNELTVRFQAVDVHWKVFGFSSNVANDARKGVRDCHQVHRQLGGDAIGKFQMTQFLDEDMDEPQLLGYLERLM